MKAIIQDRYGSPDDLELREVDEPLVGDGEVLVRVRAASVHPDVWHVVTGRPYVLRLVDSTSKLGMLRSLGADEVLDFTQDDFTRLGVRYDLIVDVPGNYPVSACRRALKPDGRYVLIGHERFGLSGNRVFGLIPHFLKLMFLSRFVKQLRGPDIPMPTKKDAMAVLKELLEAGKITPIIDNTFHFSEAREAFRHMIEDEIRGKVILTPGEAAQHANEAAAAARTRLAPA